MDTAVDIHGVGVFAASTLRLMRKWHQSIAAMDRIDNTLAWIKTVDFHLQVPRTYLTEEDDSLPFRVTKIDPLSGAIEFLDMAGKGMLGDKVIHTVTSKLFGRIHSVITLHPTLFGNVVGGTTTTEMSKIKSAFCGVSNEKILIPLNCNGNHWCCIMIDLNMATIRYYDPINSSYGANVRVLAEKLKDILSHSNPKRFRVSAYVTDMGVQVDNYSCGVFVLRAFEHFTGCSTLGHLSKQLLAYVRYRYLLLCV
ncbi:hypothetical protein PF006_g32320 [Phytophthora fragariae]|uniref:Ubiquitin-like protease family profile domain-containing protein n=1 Tax=Phytophthora fragariae TaxID=53985 RepID=A0A6A3PCJ5_9STRA|nr:hypothetical protein PF006_g32320 [Phytophthora fragariae]KAE9158200.1 hypothetical protein PF004_g31958 [Phytophthora fragariae]